MAHNRQVGRPSINLDVEDIEFLRSLRFSFAAIAEILHVSRSTLYRRMEEEGVSFDRYTEISDPALDRIITDIKQRHPNDGERLVIGHLTSQNIILPRTRIRASLHRVDPEGTALRRSLAVRRRVYHAEGPNYVWHIDGHHKLIKYRFVIHGAIDGYSRMIMYLSCSDNNRANTVLSCFTRAVQDNGLPAHIRSDLGGENIDVWRFMVEQHSSPNVVITGSSTHNERIERLWRDVYRCVGVLFHNTFSSLEDEGVLDLFNEVDMFCLHFVFLPRIQQTLDSFIESWNNHSISTENNLTPNQLFIRGAIQYNITPQLPTASSLTTSPLLHPSSDRVIVPRINFTACTQLLVLLSSQINPLDSDPDFGKNIYMHTVNLVGRHVETCTDCTL